MLQRGNDGVWHGGDVDLSYDEAPGRIMGFIIPWEDYGFYHS